MQLAQTFRLLYGCCTGVLLPCFSHYTKAHCAHRPLRSWNSHAACRLYTITLVTTAALLCASIVWPPTIRAEAQHDHAYYDSIIAPRQSTYAENKAHVITYYLKVMGLSALIGHTVKLALLANLSPPHPSSHGVEVPSRVWRAQRWVSLLGLCVLTFLMGSSLFYMMLQWRVWSLIWPYW
jgi:hypothetical protein